MGKQEMITVFNIVAHFVTERRRFVLTGLMLCTVLGGLGYSVCLGSALRYPDEMDYYNIANNIISAHTFSLDGKESIAYRPPGYPFLLSCLLFFGGGVHSLRVLNYCLLAACMYLVYRIVKKQASSFAGLCSAVGILCYPVLFYTAGTLYPQTLGACLLLFIVERLTKPMISVRDCIVSGTAFGALILSIPFFVFMLLPFAAWLWWSRSVVHKPRLLLIFVAALVPALVWSARNVMLFHTFVFVSANSGHELLLGNSEGTTSGLGPNADISYYRNEMYRLGLDPVKGDVYFRKKAIEWITGNFPRATVLYFQKLINYFSFWNHLWVEGEQSKLRQGLMLLTYGPLLLVFVSRVALIRWFRLSSCESLIMLLYVLSGVLYAIFFTRIRYRLPFDCLLICMAGIFAQKLYVAWSCHGAGRQEPSSTVRCGILHGRAR